MKKKFGLIVVCVLVGLFLTLGLAACGGDEGGGGGGEDVYYKVSFDVQGGSWQDWGSNDTLDGNTTSEPWSPTKTGYEFSGWYKDSTCNEKWDFSTDRVTEAITLYAKWTAEEYTITYENLLDGTNPNTQVKYTVEASEITFSAPTRTGYTGTWDIASIPSGSTGNKIVTAVWTAHKYTVLLDNQGGTGSEESIEVSFDGVLPTFSAPTKAGYSFDGYYDQAEGKGKKYYRSGMSPECRWDRTEGGTLYAAWKPDRHMLRFDRNGGTGDAMAIVEARTGDVITLPVCAYTRTYHTFSGWNTQADGLGENYDEGESFTVPAIDASFIYLYANWTPDTCTVYFDLKGGEGLAEPRIINHGEKLGALPVVTRKGYTFVDWFGPDVYIYGADANSTVLPQESVTLYATWTLCTYTVSFEAGGNIIRTSPVNYGSPYGMLPKHSIIGYNFEGWWTEKDKGGTLITSDSIVELDADHTIYGAFTPKSLALSFDLNGGEGIAESKRVTFGEAYGALPEVTRTGYTFSGWWTDSDALIVETTTVSASSAHTLYAGWVANKYDIDLDPQGGEIGCTVTFDLKGGTIAGQDTIPEQYVTAVTPIVYPSNPVLSKNAFVGWKIEGTDELFDFKSDITSSITLVAVWERVYINGRFNNAYDINYNWSDDHSISTDQLSYSSMGYYNQTKNTISVDITVTRGSARISIGTGTGTDVHTGDTYSLSPGSYITLSINPQVASFADYTIRFSDTGATESQYEASLAPPAPTGELAKMAETISLTYDDAFALPVAKREGHTFDGWYAVKDGIETQITDADGKSLAPYTYAEDTSVYAKWTVNS